DEQEFARLDDRAGDRQHLLLAAGERARPREPEFSQRREEAEDPVETGAVERTRARPEREVLLDRQTGEDRHRLRRIADAKTRDAARLEALQGRVSKRDAPLRGAPEAHD